MNSQDKDLKTQVSSNFLDLFEHELSISIPERKSNLTLHVLKIDSFKFINDHLIKSLGNVVCTYALSRSKYKEMLEQEQLFEIVESATKKLRNSATNTGEAGEILLYAFLETDLQAPKLLTKIELKTSSNHYVYGSDGVHLLKKKNGNYFLIFGESKTHKNLSTAIKDAFKSINDFSTRENNNIEDEIDLVASNLLKESLDDDAQYEYIKSVILPTSTVAPHKDNAFGIFLGFEIDLSKESDDQTPEAFRDYIRKKILDEILNQLTNLLQQFEDYDLSNFDFFVYLMPFEDIEFRREIIRRIKKDRQK